MTNADIGIILAEIRERLDRLEELVKGGDASCQEKSKSTLGNTMSEPGRECVVCDGSGWIAVKEKGMMIGSGVCDTCHGTGSRPDDIPTIDSWDCYNPKYKEGTLVEYRGLLHVVIDAREKNQGFRLAHVVTPNDTQPALDLERKVRRLLVNIGTAIKCPHCFEIFRTKDMDVGIIDEIVGKLRPLFPALQQQPIIHHDSYAVFGTCPRHGKVKCISGSTSVEHHGAVDPYDLRCGECGEPIEEKPEQQQPQADVPTHDDLIDIACAEKYNSSFIAGVSWTYRELKPHLQPRREWPGKGSEKKKNDES